MDSQSIIKVVNTVLSLKTKQRKIKKQLSKGGQNYGKELESWRGSKSNPVR